MSDEKIVVNVDIDLEDLIPGFLQNRSKEFESLHDALERQDFQSIQSIGHSLKGVGGGYGFDGMSDLGAKIEALAEAQELAELTDIIKQYENYLERIEIVFE